jgi:hypothetical protein
LSQCCAVNPQVQARFFRLPRGEEILEQTLYAARGERQHARKKAEELEVTPAEEARALTEIFSPVQRLTERIAVGLALLGLLLVAEFAALHPLATGHPKDGNPEVV